MKPYERGDWAKGYHWVGIYDGKNIPAREDFPSTFMARGEVLADYLDAQMYGFRYEPTRGVAWRAGDETVDLRELFHRLEHVPGYKRIQQSAWGVFASHTPVEMWEYKDGIGTLKRELHNRSRHTAWATLISHKVQRKCWQLMRNNGVQTYVDSVVVPYEIRTGDRPGDWKYIEHFPRGI